MNKTQIINYIAIFNEWIASKKGRNVIFMTIISFNLLLYIIIGTIGYFPSRQSRQDASGFSHRFAHKFLYFYYHTGNFPLATLNDYETLNDSKEGAFEELEKNGESLIMEYGHWARLGESARIWAFLPNAILSQSAKNPSIKLFNCLVFSVSLIILFWGFWRINYSLYGIILVTAINFTPFFIYEAYNHENIFWLIGSTFFLTLGLNLPILFNKKVQIYKVLLWGILSSILIGLFSEIRNEISICILCLVMINIFSNSTNIIQKLICITLFIGCFWSTKATIKNHFDYKFEESKKLVAAKKGHVYTGNKIAGHRIWHPIFCGLGDFDKKYGYAWDDIAAYRYAVPILTTKYKMQLKFSDNYHLDDYYDEDKLYYKKFDEIEEYETIVKDKVLNDITSDPIWYIQIILKRFINILTWTIPLPFLGWAIIPFLFFMYKKLSFNEMKLIIVSLPLITNSLIIYSDRFSTYNAVFVYFIITSLICFFLKKELENKSNNTI